MKVCSTFMLYLSLQVIFLNIKQGGPWRTRFCTPFRFKKKYESDNLVTPPIAEILCVKNVRAIVVCGFLIKYIVYKNYSENMKKIMGAVWELPAK